MTSDAEKGDRAVNQDSTPVIKSTTTPDIRSTTDKGQLNNNSSVEDVKKSLNDFELKEEENYEDEKFDETAGKDDNIPAILRDKKRI